MCHAPHAKQAVRAMVAIIELYQFAFFVAEAAFATDVRVKERLAGETLRIGTSALN